MTGTRELTAYCSDVSGTGLHWGGPSNTGVNFGPPVRRTVAFCGIEFAMRASCACGVPATEASTTPGGPSFGMRAKSAGSPLPATQVHGPLMLGARYKRPEIRV